MGGGGSSGGQSNSGGGGRHKCVNHVLVIIPQCKKNPEQKKYFFIKDKEIPRSFKDFNGFLKVFWNYDFNYLGAATDQATSPSLLNAMSHVP